MNVKFTVDITTSISPEKALAAFIEFGPRRTEIWSGLSKSIYQCHSVGAATAEVTEGTLMGPMKFFARERYDWSEPGTVKWTVLESNFCVPGRTMVVRVEPASGGSRVRLFYDRGIAGLRGLFPGIMMRLFGRRMLSGYYADTFKKLTTDSHAFPTKGSSPQNENAPA